MSHKKGHYGVYKKKEEKEKLSRDEKRKASRTEFLKNQQEKKKSQAKVNSLKQKTSKGNKPINRDKSRSGAITQVQFLSHYRSIELSHCLNTLKVLNFVQIII